MGEFLPRIETRRREGREEHDLVWIATDQSYLEARDHRSPAFCSVSQTGCHVVLIVRTPSAFELHVSRHLERAEGLGQRQRETQVTVMVLVSSCQRKVVVQWFVTPRQRIGHEGLFVVSAIRAEPAQLLGSVAGYEERSEQEGRIASGRVVADAGRWPFDEWWGGEVERVQRCRGAEVHRCEGGCRGV